MPSTEQQLNELNALKRSAYEEILAAQKLRLEDDAKKREAMEMERRRAEMFLLNAAPELAPFIVRNMLDIDDERSPEHVVVRAPGHVEIDFIIGGKTTNGKRNYDSFVSIKMAGFTYAPNDVISRQDCALDVVSPRRVVAFAMIAAAEFYQAEVEREEETAPAPTMPHSESNEAKLYDLIRDIARIVVW